MASAHPNPDTLERRVARKAVREHAGRDCDDLEIATASGDAERVYCETCGAVLVKWQTTPQGGGLDG